jgi:hypothetical protein
MQFNHQTGKSQVRQLSRFKMTPRSATLGFIDSKEGPDGPVPDVKAITVDQRSNLDQTHIRTHGPNGIIVEVLLAGGVLQLKGCH